MSSDPIEVLRDALARALRAGYRSGHHDTVDGRYTDVMHGDHMEFFADEADELLADPDFAALASLSAPKPESAEAVPAGYVQIAKPALREMIGDERMAQLEAMCVYPAAPPRPEASAPVGVEGVVKAMRMLAGVGIPVKPECVGRWADQLEALAQQPAAHPAITHCDNCGCDWLDNGLNPAACPYCKQPAAVDERLRTAVLEWWAEHEYDTDSDQEDGERNVYSEPPEFVRIAQQQGGES